MSALDDVLDLLARAVVPAERREAGLGDVVLHPHQVAAVAQVDAAIAEFGGALLADAPGLGKTFVALAVGARYSRRIVAAPATLRSMWSEASAQARIPVEFISFEALSRGREPAPAPFLIVDEAHRVSSRSALRYGHVAELAHHARVLLLTATPVRNRRDELLALLALFLGPEAESADEATIAKCVIRRPVLTAPGQTPRVVHERTARPRGSERIAQVLRTLPPPVALADGDPAAGLVSLSLARCWASSVASLERALWRRLQRGAAITDALDDGRVPTRSELAAWTVGEDATQMAFPFMASASGGADLTALRVALERHLDAIRELRALAIDALERDTRWRAQRIRSLLARHRDAVAIAFTSLEETAVALFGALRAESGIVLLTGSGARTAVGPIERTLVLESLANESPLAAARRSLPLRLVIATDLLAEGVNLQRASVIIHLDDPWTPAAVTQRVGRSARLGSRHDRVVVLRFAPPRAADALLRIPSRHREKERAAGRALASGTAAESIRKKLSRWLSARAGQSRAAVAASTASVCGLLARLDEGTEPRLIGGVPRGPRRWIITDDPVRISRLVAAVCASAEDTPLREEIVAASSAVLKWAARRQGNDRLGAGATPSAARRRIAARLDALVDEASPTARQSTAARVASIRAILGDVRGAGVEQRLAAMLAREANDGEWLVELERQLRTAKPVMPSTGDKPELVALLFLRRRPSSARGAPAPSRDRPTASSETAAPP